MLYRNSGFTIEIMIPVYENECLDTTKLNFPEQSRNHNNALILKKDTVL